MKAYKVPCWLQKSKLFRDFMETKRLKDKLPQTHKMLVESSSKINSLDDFKRIFEICNFWIVDKYPLDIYVYGYLDKNNVLEYLKSVDDSSSKDLYKDIYQSISFKKNYVEISENFNDEKIKLFEAKLSYSSKDTKYLIYNTGYTARIVKKFKNSFIHYDYDDLVEIGKGNTKKINKNQYKNPATYKNDKGKKIIIDDEESVEYSNYLDNFHEDNIQKYIPIFIWDNLWCEKNRENKKKGGLYIYSNIKIEKYIKDILTLIDYSTFQLSEGTITFLNCFKYVDCSKFLKKLNYCVMFDSSPLYTIYPSYPSRTIVELDCESG